MPLMTKPQRKQPAGVVIADGKPHPGRRMTEQEFLDWIDSETRAEWVDGEVIVMAAVGVDHDKATYWARSLVSDYLEAKDEDGVVTSDVLVRLPKLRRLRAPDVAVVLGHRAHIVKDRSIDGAPDLIIEVVSPDSVARDWQQKYIEYAKAGVKEYWVIDRLAGQMEAYTLKAGKYVRIEEKSGKIASVVLPGFYLRPEWVLGSWTTSRKAAAKELGV